jgi:uncharacterized membrane-anchored protein
MHGLTNGQVANQGFLRSALVLAGCMTVVALLLLPIALRQTGTGSPLGLAAAGGLCLFSACLAELISCTLAKTGAHLVAVMISMGLRVTPPLAVCLLLAASGADGEQHLAFVGYLMAFYFVMLGAETWFAVKRAGGKFSNGDRNSR